MKLAGFATLAMALFLSACASVPDATSARDALLRTDREWSAVASKGEDLERIVSFWAEDATVTPPGEPPIVGKADIRQFVRQSLATPGFHIQWEPAQAAVSADGSLGYTTGTNSTTFPGEGGKLVTVTGRYATVWERDASGEWKCVVDIWNTGP
jgi:ketosteroid isomerase-like protein